MRKGEYYAGVMKKHWVPSNFSAARAHFSSQERWAWKAGGAREYVLMDLKTYTKYEKMFAKVL